MTELDLAPSVFVMLEMDERPRAAAPFFSSLCNFDVRQIDAL
jgi:hypothetical protein